MGLDWIGFSLASNSEDGPFIDVLPIMKSPAPMVVFSGPVFTEYGGVSTHPYLLAHVEYIERLPFYNPWQDSPKMIKIFCGKWYQFSHREAYIALGIAGKAVYYPVESVDGIPDSELKRINNFVGMNTLLGFDQPYHNRREKWDLVKTDPQLLDKISGSAMAEEDMYDHLFKGDPNILTLQTCIRNGFDVAWGRQFSFYVPIGKDIQ